MQNKRKNSLIKVSIINSSRDVKAISEKDAVVWPSCGLYLFIYLVNITQSTATNNRTF